MKAIEVKGALEVLKRGRDILEKHQRWTKGAYARNNQGWEVDTVDEGACRFCTVGALYAAVGVSADDDPPQHVGKAMNYLGDVMGRNGYGIPDVNDEATTKHKHVLMSFDLAILQAEDDFKIAKKALKGKK